MLQFLDTCSSKEKNFSRASQAPLAKSHWLTRKESTAIHGVSMGGDLPTVIRLFWRPFAKNGDVTYLV